jgi:hypothetical protein
MKIRHEVIFQNELFSWGWFGPIYKNQYLLFSSAFSTVIACTLFKLL